MSKIINYFSKSPLATAELAKLRKCDGVTEGLVKIGKTRFATHYSAAVSLSNCLSLIKVLIETHKIKPQVFTTLSNTPKCLCSRRILQDKAIIQLFESRSEYRELEDGLKTYMAVVGPIARSLWSLEASTANAADAYIFWLAICASLQELFNKNPDHTGIPWVLASQTQGIVNKQAQDFVNRSPSDIYFTAFFLDPHKHIAFLSVQSLSC